MVYVSPYDYKWKTISITRGGHPVSSPPRKPFFREFECRWAIYGIGLMHIMHQTSLYSTLICLEPAAILTWGGDGGVRGGMHDRAKKGVVPGILM